MVIPKKSTDPRGLKRFYWDITLNNYTEEDCEYVKQIFPEICDAYVVGKEVGASGTPHLQMLVKLKKGNYKSYLINTLGKNYSMRPCRNMEKLRDYCQKESVFDKMNVERIKNPVKKCKNVEEAGRKIRAEIQHKRHEEIIRIMKELEIETYEYEWNNEGLGLNQVTLPVEEKKEIDNGEIPEDFVSYDWE